MPDREKIIYDIERCICRVPDACRDCSHYTGTVGYECMEGLMRDALALLKEQPTIPFDMKWNPDCEDCLPEGIEDCIECHKRKEGR